MFVYQELPNVFEGDAQTASNYKRLQRFLRDFDADMIVLSRILIGWLQAKTGLKAPYILSLDRARRQTGRLRETNWKFGSTEINVLMLAIVYKKIAFPVVWMLLGKAGNSSTEERKSLLNRYIEAFGTESIAYVTADREFAGKQFATWLSKQGISFVMRLRGNVRVANAKGEICWAQFLFQSGQVGMLYELGQRRVFGKTDCLALFVSGMRVYSPRINDLPTGTIGLLLATAPHRAVI